MKNYNQMAQDVFRRRDEYIVKRKRRKKYGICLLGCLMIFLGMEIWNFQTVHTPSLKDENLVVDKNIKEEKIIIHKIDVILDKDLTTDLHNEDFTKMDKQQLEDYYQISFNMKIPDDLKEQEKRYGIYKKNGKIYADTNKITYISKDKSRRVDIQLEKKNANLKMSSFYKQEEKSKIKGIELVIGENKNHCYYVECLYHDVRLKIISKNLSYEEMKLMVLSIIEKG